MKSYYPLSILAIILVILATFLFFPRSATIEGEAEISPFRYSGPLSESLVRGGDAAVIHDEPLVASLVTAEPPPAAVLATSPNLAIVGQSATEHVLVRGRVTDPDGNPVAGAIVRFGMVTAGFAMGEMVGSRIHPSRIIEATSNHDGTYQIVTIDREIVIASNLQFLMASHEGFGRVATMVCFEARNPDLRPIEKDLQLVSEFPYRGRLVDESGSPIAGAAVHIAINVGNSIDILIDNQTLAYGFEETASDEDGRFALQGFGQGSGLIRIRSEGYAPINVPLNSWGSEERLITMTKADAIIRGVVLDWGGTQPVAGATVALHQPQTDIFTLRTTPIREVLTDPQGRFTLDGLPAQQVWLGAKAPDGRQALMSDRTGFDVVDLDRGEEVEVELRIAPLFTFRGRVTNGITGEGIRGAEIGWTQPNVVGGEHTAIGNSDGDGSFHLTGIPLFMENSPDFYVVMSAKREGFRWNPSEPLRVILDPDSPTVEVDFELLPERTISGRVVSLNGFPIEGAKVGIHPKGMVYQFQDLPGVLTDRRGSFEIAAPVGEPLILFAQAEGYALSFTNRDQLITVPYEGDIDAITFVMDPGSTVQLLVSDEDGNPIADLNARYSLSYAAVGQIFEPNQGWRLVTPSFGTATTDHAGRGTFLLMPSEPFHSQWPFERKSSSYHIAESKLFSATRGEIVFGKPNETSVIPVVLQRKGEGANVGGRLLDRHRKPIGGVSLMLHSTSGMKTTTTDASGVFLFEDVQPSQFLVLFFSNPIHGNAQTQEVRLGSLDHELIAGATDLRLTVIVLDAQSKEPITDATIDGGRGGGNVSRTRVEGSWVVQTRNNLSLSYTISAPGYDSQQLRIAPDPERFEHIEVIELRRSQ